MDIERLKVFSSIIVAAVLLLCSCGGRGTASHSHELSGGDTLEMEYAKNLTLVRHGDGTREAILRNPWDTTKILRHYMLVPDSIETFQDFKKGVVVRTPLKRSLVYSAVHSSLVDELGAGDAVKGVCDPQYVRIASLRSRIESGEIADCGNSMAPDLERIMMLKPDAILLSPYENSTDYDKLSKLNIPIVECADYMEVSPLARAEWMKFYGMLFGEDECADSLFRKLEREYLDLKDRAKVASDRPQVLIDRLYGQTWYVPCGVSTMGTFIEDAGGCNPFDSFERSGSIGLPAEQILVDAGDAEVWLVRYSKPTGRMSLAELSGEAPVYSRIKAFKTGGVYGCNTGEVHYYEEVPFHPQWLLADLISVIHPELGVKSFPGHSYFSKMNDR